MASGSTTKNSERAWAMASDRMARGPLAREEIDFVKDANILFLNLWVTRVDDDTKRTDAFWCLCSIEMPVTSYALSLG